VTHPHPRGRTAPRLRRAAAASLAAALLVLTPVAASAVPAAPSDEDVRDARRAVSGAESSVAAIEVRLAQQSAERDTALVRVQQAAEAYTQAQVESEAAAAVATTAAASHRVAQEQAEAARRTLVAIARQSARSGGSMDSVQAFLSADGFDQVVERSTALARVSTKADAAVQELRAAKLPYIVVLTHPTTGGVTASYAMLGDLHVSEPNALIGFAGQRVIEQTIREKLPQGFQRAEYLQEHGMVDMVVHRHEMRPTLSRVVRMLMKAPTLEVPSTALVKAE